jgi:hypothetical protein
MSQTPGQTAPAQPVPGQKGYWRWLYCQMLAALGDGLFMRFNGYTVPGRTFQYRSIADFTKLLDWVKMQADTEDGTPPFRGRRYAGQGGRG